MDARESMVAEAVAFLRPRLGLTPVVGLILGSGLGGVEGELEAKRELSYGEIPGFPAQTVEGHDGVLAAGRIAGVSCAVMRGRYHRYEGHDAAITALPARVLIGLGARTLIVTNAAGGLNRTFRTGDLMLIDDHINLSWSNPLIGRVLSAEARYPDMAEPYDRGLQRLAEEVATGEGIRLVRGVYCGVLGPSYETRAEIRMLERLGADAVGMSTIPEVLVARAAGVRVLGISLITNLAAGLSAAPISHEDVIHAAEAARSTMTRLLRGVLAALARAT